MSQKLSENYIPSNDDIIDIKELLFVIWQSKIILLTFLIVSGLVFYIYANSLPNIYSSKATLTSSLQQNQQSQSLGRIADFAGISINGSGASSQLDEAIRKVTTLSFFSEHIMPNIFIPDLIAVTEWNPENKEISYDPGIYDAQTNSWVKKFNHSLNSGPSAQEAHKEFLKILNINYDKKEGFINISIDHQSPEIAKNWVEIIIHEINKFFREREQLEAEKAIVFLNQQISQTSLAEINQVLSQLIQQHVQKLTLIEANEDYIFRYLDPPVIPEVRSNPQREVILFIGLFLGTIFGVIFVISRHYYTKP